MPVPTKEGVLVAPSDNFKRLSALSRGGFRKLIAKSCGRCGELKLTSEFPEHHGRFAKSSYCKSCKHRQTRLDKYKLTEGDLKELLEAQKFRCWRCRVELGDDFCIDHDHTCCPGRRSCGGCVRGLACSACNIADGLFGGDFYRIRLFALSYTEILF